jgi:hypothetical protein
MTESPNGETVYFYGVTRSPSKKDSPVQGVGDPPTDVFLLRYKQLAAVVSRIDARDELAGQGLRENLASHADVVNRLFAKGTILPAGFGWVCPPSFIREQVLVGCYNSLLDLLHELDGKIELKLTARYHEEPLLKAVIQSEPSLALSHDRGYADKIEHGKKIVEAIERKRNADRQQILERLEPFIHDFVLHEDDSTVLVRGSLLINRSKLTEFDHLLEALARENDELVEFKCVGPLPPYSFVKNVLRVSKEETAWV